MLGTPARHIKSPSWAIAVMLVWSLFLMGRSVDAQDRTPLLSRLFSNSTSANSCCNECDSWFVDATNAPSQGNLAAGIRCLRFWRLTRGGGRQEYSLRDFAASMTPAVPTMFYVHGYGLGENGAIFGTSRLANYFKPCAGQRFRTVTWVWDAHHQFLGSMTKNIVDKSQNAEAQGYYLAHTLRQFSPDTEIALVGHSFGCRSICACLHGLTTMTVSQNVLPAEGIDTHRRIEATLIAPGIESNSLGPLGRYSCALNQVERMNITFNPDDRILRGLALIIRDPNIMGLTGPLLHEMSVDQLCKVSVNDVSGHVFGAHRLGPYVRNPSTRPALLPPMLNR